MIPLNVNQWTTRDEIAWIASRPRTMEELLRILQAVRRRHYDPPCSQAAVIEHLEGRIRARAMEFATVQYSAEGVGA